MESFKTDKAAQGLLSRFVHDALGDDAGETVPEEDQRVYTEIIAKTYMAAYAQALQDARLRPELLEEAE